MSAKELAKPFYEAYRILQKIQYNNPDPEIREEAGRVARGWQRMLGLPHKHRCTHCNGIASHAGVDIAGEKICKCLYPDYE